MRCRTCFRNDQFPGVPIESVSQTSQEPVSLMLIYCTQLQISSADRLPQQLCLECATTLETWYAFWKQCRQVDFVLRSDLPSEVTVLGGDDPLSDVKEEPLPEEESHQNHHCCVTGCGREFGSMEELEAHASQEHWLERGAFQEKRKPGHLYCCTVCLAGFGTEHSWRFHQLLLLGKRNVPSAAGELDVKVEKEEVGEFSDSESVWPEEQQDDSDEVKVELEKRLEGMCLTTGRVEHFVVRIDDAELTVLKENGDAFLKRLNRLALKLCAKQIRLAHGCESCNATFTKPYKLCQHQDSGSCEGAFIALESFEALVGYHQCNDCYYKCKQVSNIKRHLQIKGHSGSTKFYSTAPAQDAVKVSYYRCHDCGYESRQNSNMKRHHQGKGHSGSTKFFCSPRSKTDEIARKVKLFHCNDCEYKTSVLNNMNRHCQGKGHSGHTMSISLAPPEEEPPTRKMSFYRCNVCGYETRHVSNMKRHGITKGHEGSTRIATFVPAQTDQPETAEQSDEQSPEIPAEPRTKKQLGCIYCGKPFNSKSNCKRHVELYCPVLHPRVRTPKQCPHCSRVFPYKSKLARHLRYCSAGTTSNMEVTDSAVRGDAPTHYVELVEIEAAPVEEVML